MNIEIDDPILHRVTPGNPAYYYTHEYGQDRIREVHRDGSGHLWISIDGCGVRLEDADIYILGAVPKVGSDMESIVMLRRLLDEARVLHDTAAVSRDASRQEAQKRRLGAIMAKSHLRQIDWGRIPTDDEIRAYVEDAIYALGDD